MILTEPMNLVLVLLIGFVLGGIFFGGLWWTVGKAISSTRPALWLLASLLLRSVIVLTGFFLVSGGQWQRLLLCLLGFILARLAVTWLTRGGEKDGLTGTGGRSCV